MSVPSKHDGPADPSRRSFHRTFMGTVAAAVAAGCGDDERRELERTGYLLPPVGAKLRTTACAYCVVGCGYKSYSWPVGTPSGGAAATENALGVSFPVGPLSGHWISPQMYNVSVVDGVPHHIVVVPDANSKVVNVGGDHNLGGSLAQRFYSPTGATSDRFLSPLLRVGAELVPVSWEDATAIAGEATRHALTAHGPLAWGMKSYSYQFYENTYAITKLCFAAVKTPCWAPHDQPADGPSTPGLSDAGVNAFSAAYTDWKEADVLFVSGVGLVEQRAILFSHWVEGGPELIVVNPRRDETADYALANGGLFLQIRPGTDTLLHNAIARVILENDWQDAAFIASSTASDADVIIEGEKSWRRKRFGASFEQYRTFILADEAYVPERAAEALGIPAELIRDAARRLAAPRPDGTRTRASFMLEKGNYWSHNYANSASLASLGLLAGAGNRAGQMISRGGGHQRGMISAAPYPTAMSPDQIDGNKVPMNLDHWLLSGSLRVAWVVGCTWFGGGSAHASALYGQVKSQARSETLPQLVLEQAFPSGRTSPVDLVYVLSVMKARMDAGGMVVIQQDIYPQAVTLLADLVLPAASWGEAGFSRMQGERRLRHYARLVDAPGQARPDWKIIAGVAKYLGYEGFDWPDENAVFEEAAERSKGTEHDYVELVAAARERGLAGHDFLASLGTAGLQCPITRQGTDLVGTVRLHQGGFGTSTKRALFLRASYKDLVESRAATLRPRTGELQIINRRSGSSWSSLIEDARVPFRKEQLPENFLEMHPEDAAALGIAEADAVIVQTDGLSPAGATWPLASKTGSFKAKAVLSDKVTRGVACTYFNFLGDPEMSSNSVVPNERDPVSNLFSFKLGRGFVRKI